MTNQQNLPSGMTARQFYRRPLPQSCIDFTSLEGKVLFREALASGYMECFFKLISQYRTQDEIAYCGITSLVMTLNALEVDPGRTWKGPWRWYHESMLDCCTPLEVAQEKGINMAQFVCLAKCNGLHPFAVSGSDITSLAQLREEVKRITQRDDVVFIASFGRKVLGQTGDGHFSPIAGFHEGKDLVLILDTARYKYPPYWIKLQTLMDAMKTIDKDTGKSRGYVLLSIAKDQFTPLLFRPSCELSVDLKRGSLSPELQRFYLEWKDWLNRDDFSFINEDVIIYCTQHLLAMIQEGYFKKGPLCLAMPFNMCFGDESKIESFVIECNKLHISAKEVIYALKSLFVEMESTKTFKTVRELIAKSNSDNELFFQMVQCRSESLLGSKCEAECCLQSTGTSETAVPKSLDDMSCCGGHEWVNGGVKVELGSLDDSVSDTETKCRLKFDCKPEHIVTVFLFVWPHENLCQEDKTLCCPLQVAHSSENKVSASEPNTGCSTSRTSQNSLNQKTTLASSLMSFLLTDLEQVQGTYFKGEIKTMMTKFHEVIHFHCYQRN